MNRRLHLQQCNTLDTLIKGLVLSMNLFQRRKILKKANYLDLTPVRIFNHEIREDDKVNILLPRFKNKIARRMFKPPKKSNDIPIKLDEIGSAIWLLIDGKLRVMEICEKMKTLYPDKMQPLEENEKRVTQFLSLLYQQRYISFKEIMGNNNPEEKI